MGCADGTWTYRPLISSDTAALPKKISGLSAIAKLEQVVASARIIDPGLVDTSKVYIHCTVKVRHTITDAHKHFTLVAESESDIKVDRKSVV